MKMIAARDSLRLSVYASWKPAPRPICALADCIAIST
jgi:hypothetical protein